MSKARAPAGRRLGRLTPEHLRRIDEGLRMIQENLAPLDALERCGDDCQEQRETLIAARDKLLAYKQEFFPTAHVT